MTLATMLSVLTGMLLAPRARADESPAPPDLTDAVRLTVELTDGSRVVGAPISANLSWKTGVGPLTLQWQMLQTIERVGGAANFSLSFRNGDQTEATPDAKDFALRTVLGDLSVPLVLTRRIRVQASAGGGRPVAYWSFNDPAKLGADDSGRGHTLTVKGAETTGGKIGKGAATGGSGEGKHFKIESHPDLQFSGDFTCALWAWRSAPIYDGDQLIAKEGEFSLRRYQLPTERYDVELFGKGGQPLAKVSETKSGLPLEEWTLIVVSRKGDRLSIRVNDGPAVEAKVAEGEVGSDKPLFIGCAANGYPWQGKVDEIKKWDYALSEAEQRELFRDAPAKPRAPGAQLEK